MSIIICRAQLACPPVLEVSGEMSDSPLLDPNVDGHTTTRGIDGSCSSPPMPPPPPPPAAAASRRFSVSTS